MSERATGQQFDVDFDVVIVGARCAGAATARLLALQGLRVLAVDRAAFPSDTVSTHALSAHGTVLLRRWGLLDRVLATGVPNPHIIGVKAGHAELRDFALPANNPGSLCPRRYILDSIMVDAAREAGATVWEDTTVDDLVIDEGLVTGIAIRRGRDRTRSTVLADLVVGADGARSMVANAVGAEAYDVRPSTLSGLYAYYSGTDIEISELALVDRHAAFAFATNDSMALLSVAGPDAEFRALTAGGDASFLETFEAVSPRLADMVRRGRRDTRFVGFRGHDGHLKMPFGPGWALVGDAGYYKDPFTGQGMADAFLSAQLLANAVAEAGGVSRRNRLVGPLSEFQQTRDELHGEMFALTHELAMLEWTDDSALGLFMRFRQLADQTLAAVEAMAVPLAPAGRPAPVPAWVPAAHAGVG